MEPAVILIVEDEQAIASAIRALLESQGYGVLIAETAQEGMAAFASHPPDLLLLDLGLPDMDGLQVLRSVREWSDLPVIVVSARQDEVEKVEALDNGANDYVTKPFGNCELLARIRTALRLQQKVREFQRPFQEEFSVGDLSIHYARRTVTLEGNPVHLTPNEYKILLLLSKNAGRVLTHESIIHEVWGPFGGDSQVLRVNMANIRRKLEPNPADPRYILTEVGVGYRMMDEI